VIIYLLRVFPWELLNLRMLCATKTSCFARFSVKTRSWILSFKVLFFEIASLQSVHDDMSAKPCDNYKTIRVNYVDLWLVHAQVASQLDGAKLELRELKARSLLLNACTSCPLLKFDLKACSIEIKELKYKLDHSFRYSVLSPPCEMCGSLKGKLFHATKENIELK
jgi:hypothetical protein